MKHIEFKWQTVDGLQIIAQGWQPEADPQAVVCLVHGLGEHSGRYAHLAASLTRVGYAVLAFDQRGFGKSQGRRGHILSYEAMLDDITYLLDEAERRFPNRQCFLYGHSMGGNLVLNYALRHRPKLAGVIATSPWIKFAFKPSTVQVALGRVMDKLWPAFTIANGLDTQDLSHDPEVICAYENDPLIHNRISARLFVSCYQAGWWALEHAVDFKLPLLLMHGSADRMTSAEASRQFADQVPGDCTFKMWEGLYHEIHNEPQQQEVFDFLIDWIKVHVPL